MPNWARHAIAHTKHISTCSGAPWHAVIEPIAVGARHASPVPDIWGCSGDIVNEVVRAVARL